MTFRLRGPEASAWAVILDGRDPLPVIASV